MLSFEAESVVEFSVWNIGSWKTPRYVKGTLVETVRTSGIRGVIEYIPLGIEE